MMRIIKTSIPTRVLLIDDNEHDRIYLRETLAKIADFSFTEADSAASAVALPRCDAFDCVLLDHHMPGDSGLEVVTALCPDGVATLPIVMLTGQGDEALAVKAMHAGACDYLSKNTAKPHDIARAIERACERFEMERNVRQQHEQTAHALHLRDEMMSVLSHELRTPASALLLNLQCAVRQIKDDEKSKTLAQMLRRAVDAVGRINRLTDRLLDVSRAEQATLQLCRRPTNVTHLVRDAVNRFADYAATEGCSLSVQADEDIFVETDADRLDQVMTNLLSNAVKYGRHKPIQVYLHAQGSNCVVEICDQGEGVAEEDRERIFERFERATRVGAAKSLGLGLYLSQEIIAAHHGTLRVESREGTGSKFIISLPLGTGK